MWNFGMYEWMANDRIAAYRREAALARRGIDASARRRVGAPGRSSLPVAGPRRRTALAALVGLAALGTLKRRT